MSGCRSHGLLSIAVAWLVVSRGILIYSDPSGMPMPFAMHGCVVYTDQLRCPDELITKTSSSELVVAVG
jgi:hypothetical protein